MVNKSGMSGMHKRRADVWITIAGEGEIEAAVFLAINERLIDLLNDDRNFIPILSGSGDTQIVAKSQIVKIIEREGAVDQNDGDQTKHTGGEKNGDNSASAKQKRRSGVFDPYAALRVNRDASIDEIRAAYKARIKAVHPDSLAGLDLDDDLAKAALQATQRVNYAYKKILAEHDEVRRGASHDDEDAA
ncbi:MAG: J domain-containing protein [Pseudomonadota bacterium]